MGPNKSLIQCNKYSASIGLTKNELICTFKPLFTSYIEVIFDQQIYYTDKYFPIISKVLS